MTLFWLEQLISWCAIVAGWWILHQTSGFKLDVGAFLMRAGIAILTFLMVLNTIFTAFEIDITIAVIAFKASVLVMFLGVAVFHKKRFGKI